MNLTAIELSPYHMVCPANFLIPLNWFIRLLVYLFLHSAFSILHSASKVTNVQLTGEYLQVVCRCFQNQAVQSVGLLKNLNRLMYIEMPLIALFQNWRGPSGFS